MFFKQSKKESDKSLDQAIEFMIKQKTLNKKNIKKLKSMNFSINQLKEWDNLYTYIIKKLKSMKKCNNLERKLYE